MQNPPPANKVRNPEQIRHRAALHWAKWIRSRCCALVYLDRGSDLFPDRKRKQVRAVSRDAIDPFRRRELGHHGRARDRRDHAHWLSSVSAAQMVWRCDWNCLVSLLVWLIWLLFWLSRPWPCLRWFDVSLAVKAYQGQNFKLPIIGNMAEKIGRTK